MLDAQDKQEVPLVQQRCLDYVGQVEEAMVKGFPFDVPPEYANLPQLKVPRRRCLHAEGARAWPCVAPPACTAAAAAGRAAEAHRDL